MTLLVEGVSKRFARSPALNGVSLRVETGEFLALLGPSGSGKTTLLRVVAGLETPDAGSVRFDGEDFLALSPRDRRVGMVFQHYALFQHMTVAKNIAFGLSVRPPGQRPSRQVIGETVERLLALIQLQGLGDSHPAQLSGGQQQRVALARALAIEPRILLLDEPFGALDAKIRKDLRHWLRRVHDETKITTIFVTHDQQEAMDIAHRMAVLRDGRIEQVGAPEDLEQRPASAFVFDFLGDANQLECAVGGARAAFDGFDAAAVVQGAVAGRARAWFRPHETLLAPEGPGLAVSVTDVLTKGAVVRFECRAGDGRRFDADYPAGSTPPGVSNGAAAELRPKRVFVFADECPPSAGAAS